MMTASNVGTIEYGAKVKREDSEGIKFVSYVKADSYRPMVWARMNRVRIAAKTRARNNSRSSPA